MIKQKKNFHGKLYERKLLIICNQTARFGSHRYCGGENKMFLICHMTSRAMCPKRYVT